MAPKNMVGEACEDDRVLSRQRPGFDNRIEEC